MKKGFSLIDVVVGISIIALAFWGIFGVFQLSVKMIANNKAKIGALALVNEQMEFIRSLSYSSVGTVSGIPAGNIQQEETVSLNNINYTRRTLIQYVDAPQDGVGVNDENGLNTDYKNVKVEVKWDLYGKDKSVFIVSDIVPKGMETVVGGGTLTLNIFNAVGVPIGGAQVNIKNDQADPTIDVNVFSNIDGRVSFPGSQAVNNYEITVIKDGYSSAQTYESNAQNPNPNPGHLSVIEDDLTTASFAIDLLSIKTIETYSTSTAQWLDLFDDSLKFSNFNNTNVSNGAIELTEDPETGYELNGDVYTIDVDPEYLYQWTNASWNDNQPIDTNILYRVYYYDEIQTLTLIPDVDLVNNTSGFSSSPIDLSGLNVGIYDKLQLVGFLNTLDASSTPQILDWQIDYIDGLRPLSNINFHLQGEKEIGKTDLEEPILKYSQDLQTDGSGTITITDLEWDNYTITVDTDTLGYDEAVFSNEQPLGLNPGVSTTTKIILSPSN